MTQINAYINFNGRCSQAMTFYKECLDAELTIQTIGGSPIEDQCPASMKDQIMHASLTKGALLLMGSDMTGPGGFVKGNDMALSLNCSSEEEINAFFSKLSEGGEIIDPLGDKILGRNVRSYYRQVWNKMDASLR